MFDTAFAGMDEAALIAAIGQCAREEAQAGARKLAAIAQLTHLSVSYDSERDLWAYDSWAATASEVGAALSMGHKRASGQMWIATALRDRLPTVGALYLQGRLSARVVSQISWRTRLVQDWQALALLDTAIADQALKWESLSEAALERAIDAAVNRYDPDAVLRAKEVITTRDFRIGSHEDPDGLVTVYGQLLGCDAATLSERITAMVKGICHNDPRTMGERRSCAMGAIIQGHDHLPCRCGSPECTATPPPTSNVTISVIADPAAIAAARNLIAAEDDEQQKNHAKPKPDAEAEAEAEAEREPEAQPKPEYGTEPAPEPEAEAEAPNPQPCPQDSGVALSPGAKILPIAALAEAIRAGAAIKALWLPGPDPEPHYRPSAKLAAFVRARDLFCRFPGCTVPAERCDIDHVIPWPYGPTHPSNLHCKCRTHHLGKTFDDGWREEQHPDGNVTWTTPTGRRYTTAPGSQLFFPTWDTTTAELPPPAQPPPPDPDRIAKMPKRRRTRAADNAARIKAERDHNATARIAAQQAATQTATKQDRPPPEPPPF